MMLNESLHRALVQRFGEVRISNQGERRQALRVVGQDHEERIANGESYNVCCPVCGDTKFRLSISHYWLGKGHDGKRRTDLINCYNEGCQEVRRKPFWEPFVDAVDRGAEMARLTQLLAPPPAPLEPMRLPVGCVPLGSLGDDHPAAEFVRTKYPGMTARWLEARTGALYTDQYDERFRLAAHRIIFPVLQGGVLESWQGRTINPLETRARWYLPPGFRKTIYRFDSIPGDQPLLVCEGITSAVATSDTACAIFGKVIDDQRARQIAARFPTAIIALDPETFSPCHHKGQGGKVAALEVKRILDRHLRVPASLLGWPPELLERGRIANLAENEKVKMRIPDAADLGVDLMRLIVHDTLRNLGRVS